MNDRQNPLAADARLSTLVQAFGGQRVLVFGDLVLDRYLWGDVERTSPEAPVPVVRLERQSANLGGAANVAANLAALGAEVTLVGVVGEDEAAAEFLRLLHEQGIDAQGVVGEPGRPTTLKTRVVSMGQQLLRLDQESTDPPAERTRGVLRRGLRRALRGAAALVLSDYGKGVLDAEACREAIALAREAGIPVVVDPKGADYRKYAGATLIKPNAKEAAAATGIKLDSPQALEEAGRRLARTARVGAVVISRDQLGVSVFMPRRSPLHIPAQAPSVYDVNGAGDSLVAAAAMALAVGAGVVEAAQLGNLAGAICVGKFGAATVEPLELLRALHHEVGNHKLRTADQLAGELTALRAAGKRIAFTNGFFDLLHLGHLKFLEQARRLGDKLVVAINSDRSVRALKGAPRPVLGQEERAALLGSLDAVDYVVIFDDETPERLLAALRPDVLVKGRSLKSDEIVGHAIVEGYGGRIESLPTLGELTTDAVIERIAQTGKPARARRAK